MNPRLEPRRVLPIVGAGIAIVIGGLLIGQLYRVVLPGEASVEALPFGRLFSFMLTIAGMLFLLVEGLLVYSTLRFRRLPGDESDGPPIHGNTTLEIIWTVTPFIIVTVLSYYSFQVLKDMELPYGDVALYFKGLLPPGELLTNPFAGDEMIVNVSSRQFAWGFQYPAQNINSSEMYIPVNTPVRIRLTSDDVIHSFWVPEFRVKKDAIPGAVNESRFIATKTGLYSIICAELCGIGHAEMRARLAVVSDEEFKAWLAKQQPGEVNKSDPVGYGRHLFTNLGCGSCHTLADAGGTGKIGPILDDIGIHADDHVPGMAAADYIRQSILEPGAYLVPGYPNAMPPFRDRLKDDEMAVLVNYLLQQKNSSTHTH